MSRSRVRSSVTSTSGDRLGKAAYAYETLSRPLIVDDTGFFIDALGGSPARAPPTSRIPSGMRGS